MSSTFNASVIFDNGQVIPEEIGYSFSADATLKEVSQALYEQVGDFGLYDDTVPGETRYIPLHRIYSITIEEAE
ncbi:hypothetical protein [Streptomyces uncialis]|uniref:Uncharacterized protein n=1 Tax=Streptomyces uncialis TaxID=1048205 RepID=A0A1Q4VC53_9ACTN|nr:hypothetical protein [Streptomyces uncialis]OKH95428.1 hypothetical protein AB852_00780 [Streptomyces uncialis]